MNPVYLLLAITILIIIIIVIIQKPQKKSFKIPLAPEPLIINQGPVNKNLNKNLTEPFKNEPIGSVSGFGFEISGTDYPLYLNRYPPQMGADFNLRTLINKLKYSSANGNIRGLYTTGLGQIDIGKPFNPVILIPGLGSSPIFAKWSITSGSPSLKTLDAYGQFEMKEKWTCRTQQDSWVPIWFPDDTDDSARYCWSSYTSVKASDSGPVNADGVLTSVPSDGFLNNYMADFLSLLEAKGLVKGSTLFVMNYDHRKITNTNDLNDLVNSFKGLVEGLQSPAIIIGHDIGSVIANILLNKMSQQWKKDHINKFISIAGSFGGSPKALRVLLSGDTVGSPSDQQIIRDTLYNFSGLHLSLPNPKVFGDAPMITFQNVNYSANDIRTLIEKTFGPDTGKLYILAKDLQDLSMNAPGVPTYIFGGQNVNTESSYRYSYTLQDSPDRKYPYYNTFEANNNKFQFNNVERINTQYNGDGTIPDFCLKYPLNWSKQQKEPVYFKFYDAAEHLKILSMNDTLSDVISLI
jgi:lysophospholipase III